MTANSKLAPDLDDLESRIRLLLPEQYQDCYNDIQAVPMRSADLKYGSDGRVAWDEIWGSFCDLAMAGGPPHRGTLLEPGTAQEIQTDGDRYLRVVREVCRGISMATGLSAEQSHLPGWVRVYCGTDTMAGWLARAIVAENVSARFDGHVLSLPAGPSYRMEKEIKNVITSVAKTCHYWLEHTSPSQQQAVANLFIRMELESPVIQPGLSEWGLSAAQYRTVAENLAKAAGQKIRLCESKSGHTGWLGVDYRKAESATRMMRSLLACNIFSRREGSVVFVPVNPESDLGGERVLHAFKKANRFLTASGD